MLETQAQATGRSEIPRRDGEPCEACGSPLAADQRYCLECGHRRGGPRVDYRHHMGAPPDGKAPTPEPAQAAGGEEPETQQRDYAPLAAVGGIAVLGLMLLVGVLIGRGGGDTAPVPAPVIRVPATGSESTEAGRSAAKRSGSGSGSNARKARKRGKGGTDTGDAVKASEGDLEQLSGESGADYEKQSKELPNEIATPGAPPPIDKSKPPGGGEGGAEVIK